MHGLEHVKLKNSVRASEQHRACFIKVKARAVWEELRFISEKRVKRNRVEWGNSKIRLNLEVHMTTTAL
jgi:hypothetical protein